MAVSEDKSSMGAELVDGKEYIWAMISCGGVVLMLQRADNLKEDVGNFFNEIGSSTTFYMEVEDVNALYESVKNIVDIVKKIDTTWYGQREFYVRDCNGYILSFSTMHEQK